MLRLLIAALCVAIGVAPGGVQAQLHRTTDPVLIPPAQRVLQDDAFVVDINPALLGFLPTWSAAYVHAEVEERDSWLGSGDAVYGAAPLLFGLSVGASLQSIRPGGDVLRPARSTGRFGAALAASPALSFGTSLHVIGSGDPRIDGLVNLDAGIAARAAEWLGLSLVGRDLLAVREGPLDVGPSLLAGVNLRPLSSNDLVFDLALAGDDRETLGGRAGLAVAIPHLGLAAAYGEVEELGQDSIRWRVVGGLQVSLGHLSVGAGGLGGSDLDDLPDWYALARVEGQRREGVLGAPRVLEVELNSGGPRNMIALTLTLERALLDDRIEGVLLKPRGGSLGLAYAQELRMLIEALRRKGKRVVCHFEAASGSTYYACAAADRILMDPAGSVQLLGVSSRVTLLGESLRKLGLRADFVRIGQYKSAPEQFTESAMTEPAREQTRALLDDAYERMVADIAADRGHEPQRLKRVIDGGPHLAREAERDDLVDSARDAFELDEALRESFGDLARTSTLPSDPIGDWGMAPQVGVVVVDGDIVDGESVDVPIIDIHQSGGRTIAETIEAMAAHPRIRAIVLRVDSPGGAVLASDQIWRAVRRARRVKPVIASMGAVAASGGYYVASAADEIWADPSTVTGSIGVFFGKVDVVPLARKLGVGLEHFKRGRRAGGQSLWRPFTPDERARLAELVRSYYKRFLRRISEGRGMDPARLDRLARGRVYSGEAAQRVGLVDHLGGLRSALARARQLAGLARDAPVTVQPARKTGVIDFLFGGLGAERERPPEAGRATLPLPEDLEPVIRAAMTLGHVNARRPVALMPYLVELR